MGLTRTLDDKLYGSVIVPSYAWKFSFLIFGMTSGYAQYVLWRRTDAVGHGVGRYDQNYLDYSRFDFGDRTSADWDILANLIVTDHEHVNQALPYLRPDGHLVVRTYGYLSFTFVSTVWVLSHLFKQVSIIKPISSDRGSNEVFIIGRNYRPNPDWEQVIDKTINLDTCTPAFMSFIEQRRKELQFDAAQYATVMKMSYDDKKKIVTSVPVYDINKCFKLWNIPSNAFKYHKENPYFRNFTQLRQLLPGNEWDQLILHKLGSAQPNILNPPYPDIEYLKIKNTDHSCLSVQVDDTLVTISAWKNTIFLPTRMYDELKLLQVDDQYIAELCMSWNLLCDNRREKPAIFEKLIDTPYEIKTDLLTFPTQAVTEQFYGLFDIDRMFGATSSFFDIQTIEGVCILNLTYFSLDIQRELLKIANRIIDRSTHSFLLFLLTDAPVENKCVLDADDVVYVLSKHYAVDICLEIKDIIIA